MRNDLSLLGNQSRTFIFQEHKMFIDGERVAASLGAKIPIFDPTSGEQITEVPAATVDDVDEAVKSARRAFESEEWRGLKPASRERLILQLAAALEAHANEFAEIESVNSGRTVVNTRLFDVDLSVDCLRYMAGWTTKQHGKTVPISAPYATGMDFFAYTTLEPVGVVAAITPWNVPLGQAIWKIAPALATGCTVVLKPSEITPLTAIRLALLAREIGFPDGVINVVTGYGHEAGAALVAHPDIDKVSFTGSTQTGRNIGIEAARNLKKCSLELGGKSPVIILEDANLEQAIPGAAQAILGNHGQNCCAGSRLYVHESIYERVIEGVCEIAGAVKLGSALDPETEMGPLVSSTQQERVRGFITSGVQEGAECMTGGVDIDHPGFFVAPTVLANVTQNMRVVREEIFGPVLCVASFNKVEEAVNLANDSSYGLGASVWTKSIDKMHSMVPKLKAGITWVNTHNVLDIAMPFGGQKNSGIGYELSEEAIAQHTNIKSTIVNLD